MSEQSQPIVIVGAGEQADIAYEYFTHDSPHTVAGFAVEQAYLGEDEHLGLPVVALETLAESHPPESHQAFVAISSQQLNRVRRRLYEAVKAQGFSCATYVSSRAFVWHNVKVGENCMIFEGNVLQHFVEVGDNCVLWSGNHVGHRSRIGAHTFMSSHVVISGYVDIGEHCFLGVNSSFGDELTVADDTVVGAGAVVVKPIAEPRGVWVGNPAKATCRDSFQTFKVEA